MEFQSFDYGHMSARKKPRRNVDDMQVPQGNFSNSTGCLSSDVPLGRRMKSDLMNEGKFAPNIETSMLSRSSTGNMNFMSSDLEQSFGKMNSRSSSFGQTLGNMKSPSSSFDQSIGNMNSLSSSFGQTLGNMNSLSSGSGQTLGNMNSLSSSFGQTLGNMKSPSSSFDQKVGNINSPPSSFGQTHGNINFISSSFDRTLGNMNSLSSGFDQSIGNMNSVSTGLDQSIGNMNPLASGLYQSPGNMNIISSGLDQSIGNMNSVSTGLDQSIGNMNPLASGFYQSPGNMNIISSGVNQSIGNMNPLPIQNLNFVSSGQSIGNVDSLLSGFDQSPRNMNSLSSGFGQPTGRQPVQEELQQSSRAMKTLQSRKEGNIRSLSSDYNQSPGNMNFVASGFGQPTGRQLVQEKFQQSSRAMKIPQSRTGGNMRSMGGTQRLTNILEKKADGGPTSRDLNYSSLSSRDLHGMIRIDERRPEELLKQRRTADGERYDRFPSKRHIDIEPYDMERHVERRSAMDRAHSDSRKRTVDRVHALEREFDNEDMLHETHIGDVQRIAQRQTMKAQVMKRSVHARHYSMDRLPQYSDREPRSYDREPMSFNREPQVMKTGLLDRDINERQTYIERKLVDRDWEKERAERSRNRSSLDLRAGDLRDDIHTREHRIRMEDNVRVPMEQNDTEPSNGPDVLLGDQRNDPWRSMRDTDTELYNDEHPKSTPGKLLPQSKPGFKGYSQTKETFFNKQKSKKKGKKKLKNHEEPDVLKKKIEHLISSTKIANASKKREGMGSAGCFNHAFMKVNLVRHYNHKQFRRVGSGKMETAWLFVGDIFLARVFGTDKQDNKKECYEKAIQVLITKSADEIMQQEDPGVDSFAEKVLSDYENLPLEDDEGEDIEEQKAKFKSLRENIKLLVDYMNPHSTTREEVVEYLVTAFKASRCGLSYKYSDEELTWFNNMPWYIGRFELKGIPIAAASGYSKLSAKRNTFEQAVTFLKENSLYVVTEGITVVKGNLMPAMENVTEQIDLPNSKNRLNMFLEKLTINKKKSAEPRTRIMECAEELCVSVLIVDRRVPPVGKKACVESDLYLDNIFITSCQDDSIPKRCKIFREALIILLATSADNIYHDFKRLSPEDVHGVCQADEMMRSLQLQTLFTNNYTSAFDMSNVENLKELPGDRDKIIVLEKSEWAADRYNNSLQILRHTTRGNYLPFHINVTHDQSVNRFRVRLFILFDLVAEAVHRCKETANKQAAATYLFQLYQTRPTILVRTESDETRVITFKEVKTRASKLKAASGLSGPEEEDEVAMTYKEMKQAYRPEEADKDLDDIDNGHPDDNQTVMVNTWIGKAAECFMKEHLAKETLETVKFGSGPTPGYFPYLTMVARKNKYITSKKKTWLIVKGNYWLPKYLEILMNNDGQSGRYAIIPKSDLPKPSDLDELA